MVHFKGIRVKVENREFAFSSLDVLLFPERKNVAHRVKKMCATYGDSITAADNVRIIWSVRFSIGNFDLDDRESSGRPAVVGDTQIDSLIKNKPQVTRHRIS